MLRERRKEYVIVGGGSRLSHCGDRDGPKGNHLLCSTVIVLRAHDGANDQPMCCVFFEYETLLRSNRRVINLLIVWQICGGAARESGEDISSFRSDLNRFECRRFLKELHLSLKNKAILGRCRNDNARQGIGRASRNQETT